MGDTAAQKLFNIAHRARRHLSQCQRDGASLWQKLDVNSINEPSDKPVRLSLTRRHESY